MQWVEFSVKTDPEFVEPLSQVFLRYGKRGVVVEESGGHNPDEDEVLIADSPVVVKTYIPIESVTEDIHNYIDLGVRLVAHIGCVEDLKTRVIEEHEWENAWKEHFDVLHVGSNIVIVPTWRSYSSKSPEVVILLDPGMAFGTGHHPTTRTCLELLESLLKPGMNMLDVGCGSGILSMASVKLGCASAVGLEIDPIAVRSAKDNVVTNHETKRINILEGTLPHPEIQPGSFDIIAANISSNVISDLADDLAKLLVPEGIVIVSGIIDQRGDDTVKRLKNSGILASRRYYSGDWVTLVCSVE